jgi:hypothetical protein
MAGHSFKITYIHSGRGEIDVEWDGDPARTITCRIPVDADGAVLDGGAFKEVIVEQCADALEGWDRAARMKVDALHKKLGRKFVVTEEVILRHAVRTAARIRPPTPGDFDLEDHLE